MADKHQLVARRGHDSFLVDNVGEALAKAGKHGRVDCIGCGAILYDGAAPRKTRVVDEEVEEVESDG